MAIGEKVSYFMKLDKTLGSPHSTIDVPRKNDNNLCTYSTLYKLSIISSLTSKKTLQIPANGLLVFRQLGASKIVAIMTSICPGIKDTNTDVITNMDYKVWHYYYNFNIFVEIKPNDYHYVWTAER